jgi:hypothetical protein
MTIAAIRDRLAAICRLALEEPVPEPPRFEDERTSYAAASDPAFVLGRTWALIDDLIAEIDADRGEC